MKVPLVATLICLCGAASAATCASVTPAVPAQAAPSPGGLVLAAMTLQAPAATAHPQPTPDESRHDERGLLLAGIALMAAIALRRTGGAQ